VVTLCGGLVGAFVVLVTLLDRMDDEGVGCIVVDDELAAGVGDIVVKPGARDAEVAGMEEGAGVAELLEGVGDATPLLLEGEAVGETSRASIG
jgi:hypothetical protein